ncbi:MAG TPA: hypothetical protein ENG03_11010 [Thioploca sp.]|nr:hypothetical protein [Thioploca sp.]
MKRQVFCDDTTLLKVAVTLLLDTIDTRQVPVPLQAPLQPANVLPDAGLAVRVTLLPSVKDSEQSLPQLIPVGELVIVPLPEPDLLTVSLGC